MPDKYGEGQDIYCYPDSNVLVNLLGITDNDTLSAAEVEFTRFRLEQYVPTSFNYFSLAILKDIHHFLFQDLYKWAGDVRTVDISKGSTRFAHCDFIESSAQKLFDQLAQENYLNHLPQKEFVSRLAFFYSELNAIHPFRDGNGRAQRVLFECIAVSAGYQLRWQAIDVEHWMRANAESFFGRLEPLTAQLGQAVSRL
ncbi:putative adenosine monophosphate-protein transferase Fic [Duganella sp. FT80W]|uniref:protein adenylyltransferase n=1 Tax=Duganella guangzhouensis TaxID=2666084 RepID=A0A6I2KXU2_9BURK|nr:putative adenosine monophosphate-protein transferase Fic [Duganella guangzhouensis]MRW90818.1 putative adenosine monophosphate-protein transferase Fic [Duganella guangzhouensis]